MWMSRFWRHKRTEIFFLNYLARMRRFSVVMVLLLAADASVMIDDSSSSSARSFAQQQPVSQSSSLLSPSSSPPPPDESISPPKRLSVFDQEDERIRKRLKSEQVHPIHTEYTPSRFSRPNETHRSCDSPGKAPSTIGTTTPPPTSPTEDRAKLSGQVAGERRKAIASLSMLTSAQRQNEALAAFVATQVAECKVRAPRAQGGPARPPAGTSARAHHRSASARVNTHYAAVTARESP